METDIRNIRLIRKSIENYERENSRSTGEQLFATDYFDVMQVEKKELSDSFSSILGIWPEENYSDDGIAVQSYSMYCSKEMMEYEKDEETAGDPFDSIEDNEARPYLSVIQIHITPEILARAEFEENGNSKKFLLGILNDLHTVIGSYMESVRQYSWKFRIYRMLSSGDFAVVIRSKEAVVSFQISSLLRKRTADYGTEDQAALVLYKTYTLLTLDQKIIETEHMADNEERSSKELPEHGRYVIRCCFSNRYWSEKNKIDVIWKERGITIDGELFGLNGRYDFCAYMTEKDFLELFPYIDAYKNGRGTDFLQWEDTEGELRDHITVSAYIKYLLEKGYLSYINERYLLDTNEREKEMECIVPDQSNRIKITQSDFRVRGAFLDEKINEYYRKVEKKYKKARLKVDEIKVYRKNFKHYMDLLEKLIILCKGINSISDTRIYTIVLLEQLDVIMDSIMVYVELFKKELGAMYIFNCLEAHIRESVCALDGYAQYIRNNNLQSLQTPNYNIESNTSMEKILIGYGEFLRIFIEFYQKGYNEREKKTDDRAPQYLPLVVPALNKTDVSVEVLMYAGILKDWDKEQEIRRDVLKVQGGNGIERHCMVISIPTLTELGNVMTMVPSLFHEVAHQFRYEKREERNDMLMGYLVHVAMKELVHSIVCRLAKEIKGYRFIAAFETVLVNDFADAYIDTMYKDENNHYEYKFRNAPLNIFYDNLQGDMHENLSYGEFKKEIEDHLEEYIGGISYHGMTDCICADVIVKLDQLLKQFWQVKDRDGLQCKKNEIIKCAYCLAWEYARLNVEKYNAKIVESLWGKEKFSDEWLSRMENIGCRGQWKKIFGQEGETEQIWMQFKWFSSAFEIAYKKYNILFIEKKEKQRKFIETAYRNTCNSWKKNLERDDQESDPGNRLEAMGRFLGLDTEKAFEDFREIVETEMEKCHDAIIKKMLYAVREYREETADIFMCNVMDISPFGYMYIVAVNWSYDFKMTEAHKKRCMNVVISQWCSSKDVKGQRRFSEKLFENNMINVLDQIRSLLICLMVPEKEKSVDEIDSLRSKVEDMQIVWDNNILKLICQLKKYCQKGEQLQSDGGNEDKSTFLKFCLIICSMVYEMVRDYSKFLLFWQEYPELKEDYMVGVNKLEGIQKVMCESSEWEVRQLGEFCKKIGGFINTPQMQFEVPQKDIGLNQEILDFFIHMFYINKRKNAQKILECEKIECE